MTENPWLPIDTMPLSTVGTEVDLRAEKCLYSGILVTGINLERVVVRDREITGEEHFYPGPVDDFTITHTTGTIRATLQAEWRPHV